MRFLAVVAMLMLFNTKCSSIYAFTVIVKEKYAKIDSLYCKLLVKK